MTAAAVVERQVMPSPADPNVLILLLPSEEQAEEERALFFRMYQVLRADGCGIVVASPEGSYPWETRGGDTTQSAFAPERPTSEEARDDLAETLRFDTVSPGDFDSIVLLGNLLQEHRPYLPWTSKRDPSVGGG